MGQSNTSKSGGTNPPIMKNIAKHKSQRLELVRLLQKHSEEEVFQSRTYMALLKVFHSWTDTMCDHLNLNSIIHEVGALT